MDYKAAAMPRIVVLFRDDLPEVARLEADHFSTPWTLDQFCNGYDQGTCRLHGVRGSTGLLGYISCLLLVPEMEILNLAVQADFRRRGLGRALVHAALEDAANQGAALCRLEVDALNVAAVDLYLSMGFVQVGRRRGYYHGPDGPQDAVLMRWEPPRGLQKLPRGAMNTHEPIKVPAFCK